MTLTNFIPVLVASLLTAIAATGTLRAAPRNLFVLTLLILVGGLLLVQPDLAIAGKDIISKNATELKTQATSFAAAIIMGSLVIGFCLAVACTILPPLHRFAWGTWGGFGALIVVYIIATIFSDTVQQGLSAFYNDPIGFFLAGSSGR